MNVVYLLLGSNLDDRALMLLKAREFINERIGRVVHQSSVYASEPWGFNSTDTFLNQAVVIETLLSPSGIMEAILKIEHELGRRRKDGYGYISRPIDIDILFYNLDIIEEQGITIPHPRIPERMFTLMPLLELNQQLIHPSSRKTIRELLLECRDPLKVEIFRPTPG